MKRLAKVIINKMATVCNKVRYNYCSELIEMTFADVDNL